MSTYVALLRGINVGRGNRVAMAELREVFGRLGFTGVRTLLNSGNVVFDAPASAEAELEARVCDALSRGFGLRLTVVVVTAAEIEAALADDPFPGVADDPSRLLAAFPASKAGLARLRPLAQRDWAPEALSVGERAAYLWCPDGFIASRLAQAVGRELGHAVTIRNWATVTKIGAAASAARA